MSIRTRLVLGLVAISLVLVTPLFIALRSLERLRENAEELRDRDFAASLLLGRLRTGLEDLRDAERALIFLHDVPSRERMSSAIAQLSAMADSLDRYALDSAARHVRDAIRRVADAAPSEYAASLAGRNAQADSISRTVILPAIALVGRWVQTSERSLQMTTRQRVANASSTITQAQRFSALALTLAALLALGIGAWLTRSISRPVRDLERGMRAVADGNFDYKLGVASRRDDEFGHLAQSYDWMSTRLAELDKLKAEFVSVASHELKTPINVVLGYVQLFREEVYGPLTPKQREVCGVLEAQAQSLSRLVKQLLDISRIEAGRGKIDPRVLDPCVFFRDLELAFQVLAGQREIEFRVHCAESLPEQVVWDQDRMNEVLGNLLANAFKFTDRGGRVELSVEPADGQIQIEVHDTGAGIAETQLPHIFEKFYQADNQKKAAATGTGLGLAIAKEIVEMHGGAISCESTPGVGTTFSILMPVRASRRAGPVALARSTAA